MEHTEIEERQIVDRYVMGALPAEEAERFEEHYLSCPDCLDRLDLAESMQRGFRRAAGEDLAHLAAARQLAVVAWLSRLGRSRQAAALVMALFVAAVLPAGLAWRRPAPSSRRSARARRPAPAARPRRKGCAPSWRRAGAASPPSGRPA